VTSGEQLNHSSPPRQLCFDMVATIQEYIALCGILPTPLGWCGASARRSCWCAQGRGAGSRSVCPLHVAGPSYAPPLPVQSSMHAAVRMYASCLESLKRCPHMLIQPLLPPLFSCSLPFFPRPRGGRGAGEAAPPEQPLLFSCKALTYTTLQSLLALFGEEYRLYVGFVVCEACGCLQLHLMCCTSTTKLRFGGRLPRECSLAHSHNCSYCARTPVYLPFVKPFFPFVSRSYADPIKKH
jgi:hypothetical protein